LFLFHDLACHEEKELNVSYGAGPDLSDFFSLFLCMELRTILRYRYSVDGFIPTFGFGTSLRTDLGPCFGRQVPTIALSLESRLLPSQHQHAHLDQILDCQLRYLFLGYP